MAPRKQITYSQHPNHAARAAHAKGERIFRTYDTSYIQPKKPRISNVAMIVILVAVVIAIIVGIFFAFRSCTSVDLLPSGETAEIVVSDGDSASSIASTLRDAGLISSTSDFTKRVDELGAGSQLQPGTYTIEGGTSVDDIISMLKAGPVTATFTVPEGSTIAQTAEIVADATEGRVSAEDFTAAASNASVYASSYSFLVDVGTNSLEGFLFPKTYPIDDTSTADSIIRMMLDQYQTETASLDYSYAASRGLSQYDVVKLASIIEKESDADHRATVSSVFYNRLAANMRLQSDATVAYFVGHDPTATDVTIENPYNTYLIDGLTPTPINSPSLESLQAACSPEQTDYLYFYFSQNDDGTMTYTFSATYEDHQNAIGE